MTEYYYLIYACVASGGACTGDAAYVVGSMKAAGKPFTTVFGSSKASSRRETFGHTHRAAAPLSTFEIKCLTREAQ